MAPAFQSHNSSSHNTRITHTHSHTPIGVWQPDQVPELTSHTREQQLGQEQTLQMTVWQHTTVVFRELG